jgi:anti-sigma factor RsiW
MAKHPVTGLVPYLRGELAPAERLRIGNHLAGCGECRQLSDSLARTSANLVRLIEQMPAPDPLVYRAQLARKLAARRSPQAGWWRPRFAWVALAAAGASAIGLLTTLAIGSRPMVPPVDQLATETEMAQAGIGLLRDYPVVSHLDLLENYDVIEHLNELPAADNQNDAARA